MEVEFSIFQPSFYDKCEMPVMSSSDLCGDWKNFEFLPTPPRSPERDMGLVPEEGQLFEGVADICSSENHSSEIPVDDLLDLDNTAFDDVFGRLTADDKAFSDSIDEALNIIKDGEAAVDDLLQDFMWSTPGFDPFGFGPRSYDADPLVGGVPASASASAVPAPAFILIDPAHAFDGSGFHDNGCDDDEDTADVTGDEEEKTPALGQGQDENTDDEVTGDDDDEEIDVVSVHRVKKEVQMTSNQSLARHHVSHAPSHAPASTSSSRQSLLAVNRPRPSSNHQHVVKREYTDDVTPDDVASITSHVAAMHNYFSTSSASPYSHSAPQSPTPGYERRDAYKRVRSWESYPPSPASLLAKKPRPSTTVGDLRSAAGALSRFKSHAGSGCYYGNGRRGSSSLSSRCPVNKQRELHNVLERKRRDDLRGNFVNLRNILPSMSSTRDRMPKVVILRKSREYIRALKVSFQKLSEELANQEARNKHLRQRLAELCDDSEDLC